MTDREIDVQPLLQHSLGGQRATRELIDAIDAASDQGQDTWLTDGEGGKRIARIVTVDETTAGERAQTPPVELMRLVSALRYRLCDAAFRAYYTKTKRDQGQLRAEAYGYGKAIEDLYQIAGVAEYPWLPMRIEGYGRLDHSAETIAREWIGPASSDRILGEAAVTDFNAVERQRWGGPSPFAGKDSRTPAQHLVIAEVDEQARDVVRKALYAGSPDLDSEAEYIVRKLRERGLLDGGRP